MRQRLGLVLLTGLLLLPTACSRKALPTEPNASATSKGSIGASGLAPDRIDGSGAAQILGKTPSGALYALYRPERWNRDLVLYAHGYITPGLPIALPTADYAQEFRDLLLADGFAVAYSSYSENGLAVRDGIQNTKQLEGLFASRLGLPRRTFLTAHSLGGLLVVALAEQHPHRYAGVLSMSGVLGGSRLETDYVANIRVLFDYFYPGVLPGDLLHLPSGFDLNNDIIGPAVTAITTHGEGAFAISQILGIPFRSGEELVGAIVQGLVFQAIELQDLLARTGGKSFFDNSKTVYSGPLPPELLADLNARVARYDSPPDVDVFFDRYYKPTGELEIPMLALHSNFDPVVPVFHEKVYAELVQAHGNPALLVQRFNDRPEHVGFLPDEIMSAFLEVVHRADALRGHDGPGEEREDEGVVAGALAR